MVLKPRSKVLKSHDLLLPPKLYEEVLELNTNKIKEKFITETHCISQPIQTWNMVENLLLFK